MTAWIQGMFELERFELESGAVIAPLRISYAATANPDAAAQGAVVLLPSASGLKRWAYPYVDDGAAFDVQRHHVVSVDAIGAGQSSRPSEGLGPAFPRCSIRDHARAIHLLLTRGLGLQSVLAVGGPSMGAMIALELGLRHPGFASHLLLYSPSARCSALFQVLIRALISMVPLPGGLRAAGLAYFASLTSHDYLERLARHSVPEIAETVARSWMAEWDADDLVGRYAAVATHDVTANAAQNLAAVLGRLTSRVLLMPSTSDMLLPFKAAADMAALIPNSQLVPIDSDLGHWAASQPPGTSEFAQVCAATRRFLFEAAG